MSTLETVLFFVFSILGIAGAIGLIVNRNPVYSALSLILNFFSIAGLYLSLQAQFLAIIQVLVYAGAIMVLFLFVIMLLNLSEEPKAERFEFARGAAFILGIAFVVMMTLIFKQMPEPAGELATNFQFGTVEQIGMALMTDYLFPFEMISIVLIAALIGAIVVAKKHSY